MNVWIWSSGTLPNFPHVRKGNVRHVTAGKVRETPTCNCTVEVCQLPPLVVPFLGVRATHNTETTFSTFSRDLSRCLNLSQYCAWKPQWATKISARACFSPHSSFIDMPSSLPCVNWHGHLSLTYELFAQFLPNKLSILWNELANPVCSR